MAKGQRLLGESRSYGLMAEGVLSERHPQQSSYIPFTGHIVVARRLYSHQFRLWGAYDGGSEKFQL